MSALEGGGDEAPEGEHGVDEGADEDEHPKAPWHFKILVVGTVGYLIYRVIWFIGWLQHH